MFHVSKGPRFLLPLALCGRVHDCVGTVDAASPQVASFVAPLDFTAGYAVSELTLPYHAVSSPCSCLLTGELDPCLPCLGKSGSSHRVQQTLSQL